MTRNLRRVLTAMALMIFVASVAAAQDARFIVKFRTGQSAAGQSALRSAGAQVVLTLGPQEAVAARIPAAAPASRLTLRNGQPLVFPSYNEFLRRIFPRANEQFGAFFFCRAHRAAGFCHNFPSASGVI